MAYCSENGVIQTMSNMWLEIVASVLLIALSHVQLGANLIMHFWNERSALMSMDTTQRQCQFIPDCF